MPRRSTPGQPGHHNPYLPTNTLPGSPERIDVYCSRRICRQPLHHPSDKNGEIQNVDNGLLVERHGNNRGKVMGTKVLRAPSANASGPKKFCLILRLIRKHRGLSIRGLSLYCGVTTTTIKRWEWGKCLPRLDQLLILAAALSVRASVLIGEDEFR